MVPFREIQLIFEDVAPMNFSSVDSPCALEVDPLPCDDPLPMWDEEELFTEDELELFES